MRHPSLQRSRHRVSKVLALFCTAFSITTVASHAATGCTGVQLFPDSNIQNAISSNGGGTTFCFADGSYTIKATIQPKDGDRFIGVATDGTQPNIANTGTGGVFWGGQNVLVRALGIGPSDAFGLNVGTGSTIMGNRIHDNQTCGIETVGSHMTIEGNEIDHNGTLAARGIACSGGVKLHGTQGKDSGAYNIVSDNSVHDNAGNGLHVDCDGHDNTFSGNDVFDNAGIALDDETSYDNTFTNNDVHDNGFAWSVYAIDILDSIGTIVTGNTLAHNYRGVNIWADRRATLSAPQPGLGCANASLTGYHPSGVSITGNTLSVPERSGFAPSGAVPLSAATFESNSWIGSMPAGTNWRIPSDSTATWIQWQQAGQDAHGHDGISP